MVVPKKQRRLLKQVIRTLKFPPPVTATALVHHFSAQHPDQQGPSYIRSADSTSRWLLVKRDLATVNETYVLFHSTDSGRQCALVKETGFQNPAHPASAFPAMVGSTTMRFLTPREGLIVEATSVGGGGLLE